MRWIFLFLAMNWLMATHAYAQSNALKTPNMSADALFLYRNSNFSKEDNSTERNGLDIQEAELQFYSDVDPYSRLNMVVSMHPEYTVNATTQRIEQKWIFEPEELVAESDHLTNVTLKVGKFKAALGKNNLLHTHAYPFVDAPLLQSQLLGGEGLNDVGVSAAVFIPLPWFSEFTGQYLRGEGENLEFNSLTPSDGVGLGHWRNLWDLSDDLTFEAGASYVGGANSLGGNTALSGADLTFKWRPAQGGRYHSAILAGEFLDRAIEQKNSATQHGQGLLVWTQYQFAERWSARARYETLQAKNPIREIDGDRGLRDGLTTKSSLALQFDLTEFSFLRLEYDHTHGPAQDNGLTDDNKFYLQANFTIGSHPAHSY